MSEKTKNMTVKPAQMMGSPLTWAQVSLAALERMASLTRRSPRAAELIQTLLSRLQAGSGGVVVASRTTLAELMGCSLPTVERALKVLIEEGWVQRIKIGSVPALAINSRVAWAGPRGQIEHAVFTATVIASRSEQDQLSLDPPPLQEVPSVGQGEIPSVTGPGAQPPSQALLEGFEPVVFRDKNSGAIFDLDRTTGELQQRIESERP